MNDSVHLPYLALRISRLCFLLNTDNFGTNQISEFDLQCKKKFQITSEVLVFLEIDVDQVGPIKYED